MPKEETIFVNDAKDIKCNETGVRQFAVARFLLRPALCAVNGCTQPHNGSGQGRCQIHEPSWLTKCYAQKEGGLTRL